VTNGPNNTEEHRVVEVGLGQRSYSIVVGTGLIDETGSRVKRVLKASRVTVITNPTVGALYLERTIESLRQASFAARSIQIPDGEEHKSLEVLSSIYDALLKDGVDRGTPIIALGGGVVGDVTGFAAATVLRGVPYVQIPTTLLAQVDSSVGGKTGINHKQGKNLIGAFYQPRLVLCDIETLGSLPRRELLAGLAEVVKYGVILDAELFELIEQRLNDVLSLNKPLLSHLVSRSCELKAMVVGRDEKETDYRAILNFGHTLAHAVENVTGYGRYLHGEAVAIGMMAAAKISRAQGRCHADVVERLGALLRRAGLPVEIPEDLSSPELQRAIDRDKKARDGKINFVCVDEIGRCSFLQLTSTDIMAMCR
jgi:3-dehydroquinate synthase